MWAIKFVTGGDVRSYAFQHECCLFFVGVENDGDKPNLDKENVKWKYDYGKANFNGMTVLRCKSIINKNIYLNNRLVRELGKLNFSNENTPKHLLKYRATSILSF